MRTDVAKLVDADEGSEYRVVFDGDVPGQRSQVGEDVARTDYAIVRDVGLRHEQIVVAD